MPSSPNDTHRRKLTDHNEKRVVHLLFVEGLSIETVARRFGVALSTIRRVKWRARPRVPVRKFMQARVRRKKLSAEEIQVLIHLRHQDVGTPALAERFRMPEEAIREQLALYKPIVPLCSGDKNKAS